MKMGFTRETDPDSDLQVTTVRIWHQKMSSKEYADAIKAFISSLPDELWLDPRTNLITREYGQHP